MRFLLINYLLGRTASASEIQTIFPDLHSSPFEKLCSESIRGQQFIKTHFLLTPNIPFLDQTTKVVYLIRNPLDIIQSSLNFCLLHILKDMPKATSQEIKAIESYYINRFIEFGGYEHWIESGFGTIQQNIESWVDNQLGISCLCVRYEDLLGDTVTSIENVFEFLGWSIERDRTKKAVQASSFESMKALEEEEIEKQQSGVFYNPTYKTAYASGLRFMHKGREGSGKANLTAEQIVKANQVFAPIMERFNYI